MKKTAVIIGLILILGAAVWLDLSPQKNISQLERGGDKVSLIIGEKTFQSQFKEGMTAFDFLNDSGLNLKTKAYDIGILIEAIGDKENGQDGFYWMYYVNGVLPMVGADQYVLEPGDKVEFKFEKSSY